MLTRFALSMAFVVLLVTAALGQNVRYDQVVSTRSGAPAAGAKIAVCTQPATTSTTPCTPLAPLCSSLTDLVCNQPNPVTADGLGNYHFYLPAAKMPVSVQFYGPNVLTGFIPDQTFGGSGVSGPNATSIQGNQVDAGTLTVPGTAYAENAAATGLSAFTPYDIDTRYCALPTDNVSDVYLTLQACAYNHPGAHIRFFKTAAASGVCDYTSSQSIFAFGAGQWFDGRSAGPSALQSVKICFPLGVSGFIGNNQMAPGWKASGFYVSGSEAFSRTTASTFLYPFGSGYPSIEWQTVSTTAGLGNISTNGTNEAWTGQTDLQTIQILGAGPQSGTVSIATTLNSFTATCSCTPSMIGKTVAIVGAGPTGGTLYAHIIGLTGTVIAGMTGNAYLDQKPAATVSAAVSNLSFDYYGTISSHSSTSAAIVTPPVTTAVTNAYAYVGSTADAVRNNANFSKFKDLTVQNFGRHAINTANSTYPYLQSGGASNLADNVVIDSIIAQLNRGSGIYCQGGDCNLMQSSNSTFSQNQFWALLDLGFLGNTHSTHNAAGNHNDCVILPCPATGGASGGATNTTATWVEGVPYATASAPPIFHTDGTCTDSSTTVTLGSSGFTAGMADATNGSIVVLHNCGAGGAVDLVTFITAFTSATSVTVQDAPSCGGSCPSGAAATVTVYPTVTVSTGTLFSSGMVNHAIILQGGGPDGAALVTSIAVFYSTTKVGIKAAPKNRSISSINATIYFGTSDYGQEVNWYKAWDFLSGAITGGASVVTTTSANELFLSTMCSATTNPSGQIPITIVGAGPGGVFDHVSVCTAFTNSQQITIADPASNTVSGAEVRIAADGGTYEISGTSAPSTGINLYGETDEKLHPRKLGPLTTTTPGIIEAVPAALGLGTYSPVSGVTQNGHQLPISFFNLKDSGGAMYLGSGRSRNQQLDVIYCDITALPGCTTGRIWRQSTSAAKAYQLLINELTVFNFAPGAQRIFGSDTGITGSASDYRFNVGPTQFLGMTINADGSITFGCTTASAFCGIITQANTATRTRILPDASGTFCVTGSGANPCQYKSVTTGTVLTTARNSVTVTWNTTFADTSYTPNCTVLDAVTAGTSQGLVLERINAIAAASVGVTVFNPTVGSLTGTIYCSAVHN